MNNNLKYLIWVGTAVLVLVGIFVMAQTNHVLNSATTSNTVSFTGEGKVTAKPDVAVVNLSIVTESVNSKTAQDDNSKKSKAVTEYLKKQGIEEKDIKTTGYNIYPQYKYAPYGGQPTITGYQVNQSLEVKIRNLENVSSILDGVVSAGANQINGLSFQIDDPDALQAEARKKAIEDAKKKADELEGQVGIKLGKIVSFSENTGGYPIPMYYESKMVDGRGGMGGGAGPSLPAGENEIVVNVYLTYQIK